MESLRDLLAKFKLLAPPDEAVRRIVASVVSEEIGASLSKEGVSLHNQVAYLRLPPQAKAEITLHKQAILNKINERLGRTPVKNLL